MIELLKKIHNAGLDIRNLSTIIACTIEENNF